MTSFCEKYQKRWWLIWSSRSLRFYISKAFSSLLQPHHSSLNAPIWKLPKNPITVRICFLIGPFIVFSNSTYSLIGPYKLLSESIIQTSFWLVLLNGALCRPGERATWRLRHVKTWSESWEYGMIWKHGFRFMPCTWTFSLETLGHLRSERWAVRGTWVESKLRNSHKTHSYFGQK